MEKLNRPLLSIAPMVDVSNTHFRYFTRLLTKEAAIYTEMLHHNAIESFHKGILPFHPAQHPIILQLGGCDPNKLADAAELGVKYGYDEINLNVGCPSPRVQSGSFGACLMKQPKLVFDCMKAIKERVKETSCTVKCRLGVDEFDSYEFAKDFVAQVSQQNTVNHFIIHARKAYLKGLNPSQNRNVPPLWYDRVYKLQQDFPHLKFTINGGIKTIKEAKSIIDQHKVWGVMVGRAAYENPYQLVYADQLLYGYPPGPLVSREEILLKYADYLDNVQNLGYFNEVGPTGDEQKDWLNNIKHHYVNPVSLIKPVINLYHGQKGSVKYRQFLSDPQRLKSQPLSDVIKSAIELMKPRRGNNPDNRELMQQY